MNLTPFFAAAGEGLPLMQIIFGAGALLVVFFIFAGIWASRYTKVGPNQVLVISGRKHRTTDENMPALQRICWP